MTQYANMTAAVEDWAAQMRATEAYLEKDHLSIRFDEVALLFKTQCEADNFIQGAVEEPGYELFNASNDTVRTMPVPSLYDVRYSFLRVPGHDFRVECMVLQSGFSPLHSALANSSHHLQRTWPLPVHLSFKVDGDYEQDYFDTCQRLRDFDWVEAQSCRSTYGAFSYWHKDLSLDAPKDIVPTRLYIKPRINLRDAK